ncbi:MAG TPA: ASKHA domain-containing protein, partial [Anaerolineales bacterium]
MPPQHLLILQPSGRRGLIDEGTDLRTAARLLGVEIESICAENATCGKCLVLVEQGRFEKHGIDSRREHLSPLTEAEAAWFARRPRLMARHGWEPGGARLSCQARLLGDVLIHVPEESRRDRQIIRKTAARREIEIRPSIRKYYVEMQPPDLAHPQADWERLRDALLATIARARQGEEGLPSTLTIDYETLRGLGSALRDGGWKVTVTVWQDREVIQVRAGYHEAVFGAAVDIGTTTLALYLCDLGSGEVAATASDMNPQITYGEDVMSRIQYAMEHPDGLQKLRTIVIEALNRLLGQALAAANADRAARGDEELTLHDVLEVVLVGNTTMHHLALNLSPAALGRAPYVPLIHSAMDLRARELGLAIHPAGNVHVLPAIASFIGADTSGVLLAEEPHRQDENWLIVDVGTNAELVLGNRDRLVCTSTPTGPALEGAHIQHGMRAAPGAIEHVKIDDETLEPRLQIIGGADSTRAAARGICGSGIIDAVAEMFRTGILDARGRFNPQARSPRLRGEAASAEYVLAWAAESATGRDIVLTLQDVRQVQLAKAALYVAARTLLSRTGLERPDKLILAGGFGSTIDKTSAMLIGLIPDMPLADVFAVGNAAGDGARIALLNLEKRGEIARVARSVERFELPADPEFQRRYMLALNFPHMSDPFEHVAHLLPPHAPDPLAGK